jgi:hypothetical protein
MRLFDLFLRRAGVQQRGPVRERNPVSRLTVVCPRKDMAGVRKQIYLDFNAAGIKVSTLQVDRARDPDMATACITVSCPPELRAVLMHQARQIRAYPGVRMVQWGDHRHIALN